MKKIKTTENFRANNNLKEHNFKLSESLFETFYEKTFRAAYYITRDIPLAEDATQDAFVRAFEKIDQLRDSSKLGPWLAVIAANQARYLLNNRQRYHTVSEPYHFEIASDGNEGTIEEIVEQKILMKNLLENLPIEYLEVVVLKFYYDLKIDEIASVLGIKPGTVKSRLYRAKQELRELLVSAEPGGESNNVRD